MFKSKDVQYHYFGCQGIHIGGRWYKDNFVSRNNGPAIIYYDGTKGFFKGGVIQSI
jgi:hypothetical protein